MSAMSRLSSCVSATSTEVKNEYFQWLCNLVEADDPDHSFIFLMKELNKKEFFEVIPNDDNRGEDGKKLRESFIEETNYSNYSSLEGPCTVLEVIIGLAIRMEENLYNPSEGDRMVQWFWELVENLGLGELDDNEFVDLDGAYLVDKKVDIWLNRLYKRSGEGGLFPLKTPRKNQREVEIWYQMMSYLSENYDI